MSTTHLEPSSKMYFTSETWLCAFGVLVAVLLRCGTTLHPYSGQGKPPMFGDYEAQRHWMEVTLHLPVKQWYHNSTENDLLYWGLDYPPLTAYHSYLCGWIASLINPQFVALGSSRGYESEEHKLFMRYTVLVADVFLYIPAVILYFLLSSKIYNKKMDVQVKKSAEKLYFPPHIAILLSLFYPGLILIDHGHFQYNCVSLAFAIFAIAFICTHKIILGSIFFCLAVNYKQMELYHSLPFFMYLLSTCVPKPEQDASSGIKKFCKLAVTVLITFSIIWSPFLFDIKDLLQVLHRLFPLSRGVFEDKVANFWCTLNVFYKFKTSFTQEQMVRYCTVATLVAVLPSSIDLFLKPNVRKFLPALINSSLAFFIFSFQVHEKSILLAAVPATLYLQAEPFTCFWFLIISVFSMFPLIVKDSLVVAFVALTIFYIVSFRVCFEYSLGKLQNSPYFPRYNDIIQIVVDIRNNERSLYRFLKRNKQTLFALVKLVALSFSLLGCLSLVLLMLTFKPPENYPDIFPLLISAYSCIHFLGFFVYFNVAQFQIPQAMEDVRHIKLKDS